MYRLLCYFMDRLNTCIFSLHPRITIGKRTIVKRGAILLASNDGRITIEENSLIEFGAVIDASGGFIRIGMFSTVQVGCGLYGHGGLEVGNGVRIAAGTKIIPANHRFDELTVPIFRQGLQMRGITIHDDVWLGANCVITDGVCIQTGVVVGAGSVVTKDLAPNAIYAGVPAKMIRKR